MSYVHHDLGFWEDGDSYGHRVRVGGSVEEYKSLDEIPPAPARSMFNWMEQQGESVISCGASIFEIRRKS